MVTGELIVQTILFIALCSSLMAFLLSVSLRWMAIHFWLSLMLIAGLFFSADQVLIGTSCLFIAFFSFCLHLFYGLATSPGTKVIAANTGVNNEPKTSDRLRTGFYALTAICLSTIIAFAFDSAKSRQSGELSSEMPPFADVAGVLMNRQFFSIFLVLLLGLALILCWSEILGLEQKFERGKGSEER